MPSATASPIVEEAAGLSQRIRQAGRHSAFESAAHDFQRLLETVPDHAAGEISGESVAALNRLGDEIVDAIEDRIASGDDSRSVKLALSKSIYSIRYALEEVDRWHRHYGGAGRGTR